MQLELHKERRERMEQKISYITTKILPNLVKDMNFQLEAQQNPIELIKEKHT